MKDAWIAWLLGIGAIVIGVSIGTAIGRERHEPMSVRIPHGVVRELPQVPVAAAVRPDAPVVATIFMTPFGYQPQTIEVASGSVIEFRNAGKAQQWPRAEGAPRAAGVVEPGTSWYARLEQPGTYTYRDFVYPSVEATMIVR